MTTPHTRETSHTREASQTRREHRRFRQQSPRRWTRRLVIMLCTVLAAAVVVLGGTQPASADDCKPSSVPDHAGSGLPGLIDSKSAGKNPTTKYGHYGWSGLQWTTCDLDSNMVGIPKNDAANATLDKTVGNFELGIGTALGALMTQLHQWATHPGQIMKPIDSLIGGIAGAVKKSTWTPWVTAAIIVAAIAVILNAFRGEVRQAGKTTAAVFLACLAVAWLTAPIAAQAQDSSPTQRWGQGLHENDRSGALYAAQAFDGVAASIASDVDKSMTGIKSVSAGSVQEARGATLQDNILYEIWARGELGSSWKKAGKLYRAGTVNWTDTDKGEIDSDAKQDEFNDQAQKIKDSDENAYDTLRGVNGGRTGFGALAVVIMGCMALVRVPAELLVLAGLLVMRVLVMFGPVLALTAIVPATRSVAISAVKIALASVVNVAIYGVIAAVYAVIVGAIATNANNLALATVGIIGLTIVVFLITKPFRSVTRLATGKQAGEAMEGAGDAAGKTVKTVASVAAGTAIGEEAARPDNNSDNNNSDNKKPRRPTGEDQHQTRPLPPPESPHPRPGPAQPTGRSALPSAASSTTRPVEWRPDGPVLPPAPQHTAATQQPAVPPPTTAQPAQPLSSGPAGRPALTQDAGQPQPATGPPAHGGPDELDEPVRVPVEWDDPHGSPAAGHEHDGPVRVPVEWEYRHGSSPVAAPGSDGGDTPDDDRGTDSRHAVEPMPSAPSLDASPADQHPAGEPVPSPAPLAAPLPDQPVTDPGDDPDMYRPPATWQVIDQSGQTVTVHDRMIHDVTVDQHVTPGPQQPARVPPGMAPHEEPEMDAQGRLVSGVFRPGHEDPDRDLVGAPA